MTQPRSLAAAAACLVLAATSAAHADVEGDELEFETDELPEEDEESASGAPASVPDATERDGADASGTQPVALSYPLELIRRPVVLPKGLVETSLSARAGVRELVGGGTSGARGTEAFRASGTLAVSAGIAEDVQVGIRYGAGSVGDVAVPGRAASVEAVYAFHESIGAQVALPFHFDPFALGLTLGAPVKVVLSDKFALMGGHDLVTFRLHRFQPHVDEAAENELLADAVETNTVTPAGEYALRAAAIYQSSPDLAIGGELALRAIDFDSSKPVVPLFALFSYTPVDYVDVGGKVGFFNLDGPGRNFGGHAFVAIRM